MKIAVTGKGGVGKTTLSAVLARLYAEEGRRVLTADVDPDANLGMALGFTEQELEKLTPISEMGELIAERTGSGSENFGKMFKLNPKVDDIPDKYSIEKNGVKLLIMGTVETGGSGCVCPEHVLLKRVVSNIIVNRDEVVILDMEAGLEHLGRGTTDFVDRFVVVIEPGARSVQTYKKIKQLAADLGITKISIVANKIRSDEDREFLKSQIPEGELLGFISYNEDVIGADKTGCSPYDIGGVAVDEIRTIKNQIDFDTERNG